MDNFYIRNYWKFDICTYCMELGVSYKIKTTANFKWTFWQQSKVSSAIRFNWDNIRKSERVNETILSLQTNFYLYSLFVLVKKRTHKTQKCAAARAWNMSHFCFEGYRSYSIEQNEFLLKYLFDHSFMSHLNLFLSLPSQNLSIFEIGNKLCYKLPYQLVYHFNWIMSFGRPKNIRLGLHNVWYL